MPPVAAIAGAVGSAAGGIGGAIGGAASGIGGALGGIGGVVGQAGSLLGSLGGMGGGGGGGADPLALYNAQVAQAMAANEARQGIADEYFGDLIGKRRIKRGPNKGKLVYGHNSPLLFGENKAAVFGKRPEYTEVDFETMLDQQPGLADTAADVRDGALRNFAGDTRLADAINQFLTADAKSRATAFDPYLLGTMEQTGQNAALASQGILPSSDLQQLVGGRNEMASLNGTAGTSRGQVARDLGLTRMDLQTRVAPQLTAQNAALIDSFVPAALRADPRQSQVQLSQALQIGAADNQFEATFDRNEQSLRSLLEAMPDPQAQGLFKLKNALRAQQFAIDFGLADGFGVPNTMPDGLGEGGILGFSGGVINAGNALTSLGSILGGGSSMSSPGMY